MTNIYIIRHAEAEGNIYRRIHGHYNSRITHNGYRQIKALEERFKDIHLDAVYASDLFRTCETAKALYLPKGLPLHKDARFREVYLGRWEDLNFGYLDRFEPEQNYNFGHDPVNWYVDGCERHAAYTKRFLGGLKDLAEKHPGQTIAIFTHGCVSGESLRVLFPEGMKAAGHCDNTGTSLLYYENGVFSFSYLQDNSHLTPEISTLAHQKWWRGKRDFNLWFRPAEAADACLYSPDFPPVPGQDTFIAMLMDKPVGYLSYDAAGALPEISCLYLQPEYRYLRMGDQLLGHCVCTLRHLGKSQLIAKIPNSLPSAHAFFAHHGAEMLQGEEGIICYRLSLTLPVY